MNANKKIIEQTKNWLSSVIVEHNICPFAGRELKRESIRYSVQDQIDLQQCLENLIDECNILDADEDIATSLLIYKDRFAEFDSYLDFVDMANVLMNDVGYEGCYQLASFHPEYCFANTEQNDAANYTNRSPYPMLHIIREASLEQALKDYPEPETIPENNVILARKLGLKKMQAMLQACYDVKNNDK